MIEDSCITKTSRDQHALELRLLSIYSQLSASTPAPLHTLTLLKSEHVKYLHGGLGELPAGFASLDSGRPWICYWVIHSLLLLRAPLPHSVSPTGASQHYFSRRKRQGAYRIMIVVRMRGQTSSNF